LDYWPDGKKQVRRRNSPHGNPFVTKILDFSIADAAVSAQKDQDQDQDQDPALAA